MVTYRRLKTKKNSKTVSRKSGRGRLREVAVYERFQYKALTENIFGVLGRWSLMGGGRMWRLDCTLRNMSWPKEEIRIIAIKFYMGITALKGVTHEATGKPAVFVVAHNGKTP